MKIAIIGSGKVGTALGTGWAKSGHMVLFGVRNPASPKASRLTELASNIPVMTIAEACKVSDVIVITTPPEAVLDLIPKLGDLSGKVIIDATNSIRSRPEPYPTAFHALKGISGADAVVKCFNTTGFENMQNPVYRLSFPVPYQLGLDMFAAGNSQAAKSVATQLAKDLGFENCYDFGGDDKVELLEKFALCWINLAIMQGHGRDLAFKIIKR